MIRFNYYLYVFATTLVILALLVAIFAQDWLTVGIMLFLLVVNVFQLQRYYRKLNPPPPPKFGRQ